MPSFTVLCYPDDLNDSAVEGWSRTRGHIEDERSEAKLKIQLTAR